MTTRRPAFLSLFALLMCATGLFFMVRYFDKLWQEPLLETVRWPLGASLHFPFLGEAIVRAATGLGGAAALILAAGAVGAMGAHLMRWRFASRSEANAVTIPLGIGIFSLLGLLLAGVGVYNAVVLRGAVALVLLGLLGWIVKNKPVAFWRPAFRPGDRVWVACAFLATTVTLTAALAPETEYDAVWYHLTYPKLFLEHGNLFDQPQDFVSLYPMGFELWFGYGLALGGPIAAKLLHFACLPLAGLLTYHASRFVTGAAPWLAVAIFVTIPTVMWEASTAYVDLALGLYVTLAFYSLVRFDTSKAAQWLWIAALSLGFALTIKHLALIVLALVCIGLAVRRWREKRAFPDAIKPSLIIGIVALLFAMPWYVRSWLGSHNPVFPELYWLFGASPERWNPIAQEGLSRFLTESFGRERTLTNLLLLPWDITMHAARYGGSFGPIFLLTVPALLLRPLRGTTRCMLLFVGAFFLFWASPISSFQLRFLVPIAPLLSVLAAAAYGRAVVFIRAGLGRRAAVAMKALVALLLILNLPFFTAWHERDRIVWEGWINHTLHGVPGAVVFGQQSSAEYLAATIKSYSVWQAANATLPRNARVLTWSSGDHFYTQRDRIWLYAPSMSGMPWADISKIGEIRGRLKAAGVTHLIIDNAALDASEQGGFLALATLNGWADRLYQDRNFSLYAIR